MNLFGLIPGMFSSDIEAQYDIGAGNLCFSLCAVYRHSKSGYLGISASSGGLAEIGG